MVTSPSLVCRVTADMASSLPDGKLGDGGPGILRAGGRRDPEQDAAHRALDLLERDRLLLLDLRDVDHVLPGGARDLPRRAALRGVHLELEAVGRRLELDVAHVL